MNYLFMFLEVILYIVCIVAFTWMFLEDFKANVGFSRVWRLVFNVLVIVIAIMGLRNSIVDIMMM